MRRSLLVRLWLFAVLISWDVNAELVIEIIGGTEAALPIAVVPFGSEGVHAPENVSAIIRDDLARSGRFDPVAEQDLISSPHQKSEVNFTDWRLLRTEGLLIGNVSSDDGQTYQVQFELFDVYKAQQLVGMRYDCLLYTSDAADE